MVAAIVQISEPMNDIQDVDGGVDDVFRSG